MTGWKRKTSAKFVIAGGFGAGKTTFVASVSEIDPLETEAAIGSTDGRPARQAGVDTRRTTTVAMDFGRITIEDDLVVYLVGTPGHERFDFLWDDLVAGALGAVVLVDPRRLIDGATAVEYFDATGTPFVVAVNAFDDCSSPETRDVRRALRLEDGIRVLPCDARDRSEVKKVLLELVDVILGQLTGEAAVAAV